MALPLESGTKNMKTTFFLEKWETGNSWKLTQVRKANFRPQAQNNPENTLAYSISSP